MTTLRLINSRDKKRLLLLDKKEKGKFSFSLFNCESLIQSRSEYEYELELKLKLKFKFEFEFESKSWV